MSLELAKKISMLPAAYEGSDKSTAVLLHDVAPPDVLGNLPAAHIEQVLKAEPQLVDLWFKRGSDQRISGGWGVEGANGDYRVQSFSDGQCLHFEDRAEACAAFIVRYVSYIAKISARRGH